MKFVKMHGTGNDYVYINLFEGFEDSVPASFDKSEKLLALEGVPVEDVAVRISDRHFGIGSDGLIAVAPSRVADVRMIMYNLDGSEGAMCGNGIRCVAKFAYDRGLIPEERRKVDPDTGVCDITAETASGIKYLKLTIEDGVCTYVSVDMGQAILVPKEIPVDVACFSEEIDDIIVGRKLKVGGREYPVTCVSMGNPHCVLFLDDLRGAEDDGFFDCGLDAMDLEAIGPLFEKHEAFPEQINTEFVEVIDDHTVKMRVWERGSGETWSCGTGTCAVTVATVLNGYVKRGTEVEVQVRGGKLYDTWFEDGNVRMKGPAEDVFEGEIRLK